jgi:hypothetical protein
MEKETLTLENICNGGVPEIFERELGDVLKNIADVNTDPEETRKITFEFIFEPTKDRSGAIVRFRCKSKVAPVEEVAGQMFLQRKGTGFVGVPYDPKQARLFNPESPEEKKEKGIN